ncbi:MAG: 50S ribosomal protein L18 [Rickettsiales bacterium]|jgi:large subunit ribosomal protein L18|nr:50S ribosomal protein L18 [Rickettsiales bacterium]
MTIEKRRDRNTLRIQKCNKSGRPILSVFRSNKNISVQIIDIDGKVITTSTSASKDNKLKLAKKSGIDIACFIGEDIAKKALDKNVKEIVFNKGPYSYTGRVKAVADGARKGGLVF